MTLLEAQALHFSYSSIQMAVADASLKIEKGSLSAFIGPNGCGKSTLLRMLGGLLKAQRGSVFYRGQPLRDIAPRALARQLAYVPQNTAQAFPFTALEVVLTGRTPYTSPFRLENRADIDVAMESLDAVGMAHLARRRITEVSGGERQLVFVARALAQQPECILLDEPSSSLDMKHRSGLVRLFADLRDRTELTVGMVTHDLNLLHPVFDRVFAMRGGGIAASGTPAEILQDEVLADIYDDPYVHARKVEGQLCVWSEVRG